MAQGESQRIGDGEDHLPHDGRGTAGSGPLLGGRVQELDQAVGPQTGDQHGRQHRVPAVSGQQRPGLRESSAVDRRHDEAGEPVGRDGIAERRCAPTRPPGDPRDLDPVQAGDDRAQGQGLTGGPHRRQPDAHGGRGGEALVAAAARRPRGVVELRGDPLQRRGQVRGRGEVDPDEAVS